MLTFLLKYMLAFLLTCILKIAQFLNSFTNVHVLNFVHIFVTPWTEAYQAPVSMGFPSKNTGVNCHFLLQRIFKSQGLNLHLLHWQADSLPLSHQGSLRIRIAGQLREEATPCPDHIFLTWMSGDLPNHTWVERLLGGQSGLTLKDAPPIDLFSRIHLG